ncbi:MAG: DJ-1/PfpI family protein [Treponema sp.]|nr:DJ-1/PfpI family protein [Treponema sp.]
MKNVVIFIADGSEEVEAFTPVDYLRRAGLDVTLVSVGTESRTVTCSHKVCVTADITLEAYLSSCGGVLPDAVVVPGGMPGTKNIAATASAISFINAMDAEKKLVCAICAAPALVLSKTTALEGKKWTCYTDMESEAGDFKKNFVEGKPFIHDSNVITGRGAGTAEEFAMEIVKTLAGEEAWRRIKTSTLQR